MEKTLLETIRNIFSVNNISDIDSLHKNNIVRHLRDDEYITRLLLKFHENIPYTRIYEFVKTNQELHNLIEEYEQKVIKTYLLNFINYIEEEQYELNDLEELFRQSVINNLMALGINKISIEKCLEENIDLWFNECLEKTYNYKFNYDETNEESRLHKLYFYKMKKYIYYQRHQYVVILFGKITPEMLMTDEEAKQLQMKLLELNQKVKKLTLQ